MIDIVREHGRNVTRWNEGDMRLRWAGAGVESADGQIRRVKGYRQPTPQIRRRALAALRHVGADDPVHHRRYSLTV